MQPYLVVTFSDHTQAEAAYQCLQLAELNLPHLDILGPGYKSLNEVNVIDPNAIALRQSTYMLWWLIPLGFFAGFGFNDITHLTIWESASPLINHCIGGILGAVSGAMGGFTFGGSAQLLFDPEKSTLAKRIQRGKYLLIAQGPDLLLRQSNRAIQRFSSESVQFYVGS